MADDLYVSLVLANGVMIAFNLVPIRGLDGHKAWTLFRLRRTASATRIAVDIASHTAAAISTGRNRERAVCTARKSTGSDLARS